jgi:hypothetical protein
MGVELGDARGFWSIGLYLSLIAVICIITTIFFTPKP